MVSLLFPNIVNHIALDTNITSSPSVHTMAKKSSLSLQTLKQLTSSTERHIQHSSFLLVTVPAMITVDTISQDHDQQCKLESACSVQSYRHVNGIILLRNMSCDKVITMFFAVLVISVLAPGCFILVCILFGSALLIMILIKRRKSGGFTNLNY